MTEVISRILNNCRPRDLGTTEHLRWDLTKLRKLDVCIISFPVLLIGTFLNSQAHNQNIRETISCAIALLQTQCTRQKTISQTNQTFLEDFQRLTSGLLGWDRDFHL